MCVCVCVCVCVWRDSSVSVVTRLQVGRPRSRGLMPNVRGALGPAVTTLFYGTNRPWREADRSPPSSAKVKKVWIYTATLPYAFMAYTHTHTHTHTHIYIYIYIY